ncbi:MAG: prealbumin-like fold domain-containing protein [Lachnospiraceae bacterium]|nr:prealbumin-like fold domain-containing protein [Lachnospiraceae bacterium]
MRINKIKRAMSMVMAVTLAASGMMTSFTSYAEAETETLTEVETESESTEAAMEVMTEQTVQESETEAATEASTEAETAQSEAQEVQTETEAETESKSPNNKGSEDSGEETDPETETVKYTVTLPYYESCEYTYDVEKVKEQTAGGSTVLEYAPDETVEIGLSLNDDSLAIEEVHVTDESGADISYGWDSEGQSVSFLMPEEDVSLSVSFADAGVEAEAETEEIFNLVAFDVSEGGQMVLTFIDGTTETVTAEDMSDDWDYEIGFPVSEEIQISISAYDGYSYSGTVVINESGEVLAEYSETSFSVYADKDGKTTVCVSFMAAEDETEASGTEVESEAADGMEDETDIPAETETETGEEGETEAETEAATEAADGSESATSGQEDDEDWVVDDYPENNSTVYFSTRYVWVYDTTFDPAGYLFYEDDANVIQTLTDGTVGFEVGETYEVTYQFTIESTPGYSWTGVATFEVVSDRDLATAKLDICDDIILGEITQGEEWIGVIPSVARTTVEGPDFTAYVGDESFDLYELNLGYDPSLFNMTVYDDGGFDINTVGEYTVVYEVSHYMLPNYPWYVECTVTVVEAYAETTGVSVHAVTRNLVVNVVNTDGTSGQASYGVDYLSEGGIATLTVTSYLDGSIEPEFALLKNGEEVEDDGWYTVTESSDTSVTVAVDVKADEGYTIEISDAAYDITNGGDEKSSGGWIVDEDLEDALVNGTLSSEEAVSTVAEDGLEVLTASLTDGEETSQDSSEDGIAVASEDDGISTVSDDDGISTASTTATYTKTWTGSSDIGTFAGTSTCHNYVGSSSYLAYNGGYLTLTSSMKSEISEWAEGKGSDIDTSDLTKIYIACSDGDHSRYGWYSSMTTPTITLKATLTMNDDGTGRLKVSITATYGDSYQTFAGSKTYKTETTTYYLKIKKYIRDSAALNYTSNLQMNTSFTIYSDAACTDAVTTVTIDADFDEGDSMVKTVYIEVDDAGDYYCKETGFCDGCLPDYTTVYGPATAATTKSDAGAFVTEGYTNSRLYNEAYLFTGTLLTKVDGADSQPLAGAVYKLEFTDEEDSDVVRTWYLQTDENGILAYDEDHYLSSWNGNASDEYVEDHPYLPVGWIHLTEVEAPEGYILDSTTYTAQFIPASDSKWMSIEFNGADMAGAITVSNTEITGYGYLKKTSSNILTDGNAAYSLEGAVYAVSSTEDMANVVATLTTGSDGVSNTVELIMCRRLPHRRGSTWIRTFIR